MAVSRLGKAVLGTFRLGAAAEAGLEQSASHALSFTQAAKVAVRDAAAIATVTFSQVLPVPVVSILVKHTVTFNQLAEANPPQSLTANNTVTFSQITLPGLTTPSINQSLTFAGTAILVGEKERTVIQNLIFTHSVAELAPQTVGQSFTFSHAAGAGVIIPGGIERVASNTVTFSQDVSEVHILAGAVALSGSDTVTFSQNGTATPPILVQVPQSFILTQTATSDIVNVVEHTITFTQTEADLSGSVWPRTVAHSLNFSHAMVYLNQIDTCRYSPAIGASTDPNAPAPPPASISVTKESQITLSYPTTTPTTSVTIRAPEYGERHRLNFDRINRESRGGSLQIFSDPKWPKLEILEASFTGLKESEGQAVLDFFQATLGLEIKLIDWYGKTWFGVIVTPDAQLIRARRDIVDLSFEFEGEVQ